MTAPSPDSFSGNLWLRLQGAAMDQAGEAIIVLEEAGGKEQGRSVVSVNHAFTEMTGYASADILGKTLYLLKGPKTNQEALDRISNAMERRSRVTEDILNYRRDGSTFWARCTLAPVELRVEPDGESDAESGGEPDRESRKYWVSVLRDITAEQEAKIRAEKSEARYRALVDSFPNGAILLFDTDLTLTLAGGEALRRAGFEPRQIIGRSLARLLPEEYAGPVRDGYEAALRGTPAEVEIAYEGRIFETQFVPVSGETGAIVAGMVVAVDVTERRRAKRQLDESETRFRIVAENMRDLVCLHRPDGSVEWVSPSVEQLLGYAQEEFRVLSLKQIVHADDVDRMWKHAFAPILSGEPGTRGTYQLRHQDGTVIWFEMLVRPVLDDGRVIKLLTTSRDVTERKNFEDRLVRAKEHAEKMNRLKTAFLANMSHEIRTPLTNVIGFSDVLAQEVDDPQRPFVEHIQNGGRRLLHTLNSVLDHAQLESETVRLRPNRVSATHLVRDVAAFFMPQTNQARIDLHVDAPDSPVYIYTDSGALERVITNLLSNAIKFTPSGTVTVSMRENISLAASIVDRFPVSARLVPGEEVEDKKTENKEVRSLPASPATSSAAATGTVSKVTFGDETPEHPSKSTIHWVTSGEADPDDLDIEIRVSDTGVGIDPSFLPNLFVPFEQESTGLSRSFEGTGLGLSISTRLVHMLGGVISAETVKGEGSTFSVFLPRSI